MDYTKYDQFLAFFSRDVLNDYKLKPDLYKVQEDHNGGIIYKLSNPDDTENKKWYQIRYGIRKLRDNSLCIAALKHDLINLPDSEKLIWRGYELSDTARFAENDPGYIGWVKLNLEADWNTESPPLYQIYHQIKLINAITDINLGVPFFNAEENPLITNPLADNTESYKNAHLELYRLIIDEMNKEAIEKLANQLNITLADSTKRFKSLKEILPAHLNNVHKEFKHCYDIRQKKHGVSTKKPESLPAFEMFNDDLSNLAMALKDFTKWLEDIFNVSADNCLERIQNKSLFSNLELSEDLMLKYDEVKKAEGKTIQSIEYGHDLKGSDTHMSEGLVFNFTDGTSLSVLIGSNVWNITAEREDLEPSDFHADLMFFWAPSIKKN